MKIHNKPGMNVAALAEYGTGMVPMQPGWNARAFNKMELARGSGIIWKGAETVRLTSGTYHIAAFSLLSNMRNDEREDAKDATLPGYCALFRVVKGADDEMLRTGTMMNASYHTPSFIDTFLKLSETTDVQLKHQIGGTEEHVQDIYLQIKASSDSENQSSNHVFATMTIRRL